MFSADDARKAIEESKEVSLEVFDKAVKEAIAQGDFSCTVDITGEGTHYLEQVLTSLEYKVQVTRPLRNLFSIKNHYRFTLSWGHATWFRERYL